jgi:CII-binding regulator of phage lambda lysogenization HflD
MPNKVRTKYKSSDPNANKIATMTGLNEMKPIYKDLFAFDAEVNGIDYPLGTLFESILNKNDKQDEIIKLLTNEVKVLNQKLEAHKKVLDSLNARLIQIETLGKI